MPIPSSGPISMSMFNTILGRSPNTSNSILAGGSTPTATSLFGLANLSGSLNQTAPHGFKEWYGYSVVSTKTINIYASLGDTTSETLGNYAIYYNLNGGGDTSLGFLSGMTTSCNLFNNFSVSNGTTLYIGVRAVGGSGITFNAVVSTTCPANNNVYCGTLGTGDGSYYNYGTVNSDINIALTIYVGISGGTFLACGGV